MDLAAFREAFPQFADTTAYPDARLNAAAGFAEGMLSVDRWGDQWTYATMLYLAHLLTITGPSGASGGGGTSGGGVMGLATSKSVDKVSISYNVDGVTYAGAGFWNMSRYGVELWMLIQMFGAGPIQVMGNTAIVPLYGSGYGTLPGFLFP